MKRSVVLLASEGGAGGKGGLAGAWENIRNRFSSGKVMRPMDPDDPTKLAREETTYRYPSPGQQAPAQIPQGDYQKVFNISYYDRDSRRTHAKASLNAIEAASAQHDLPPTPGKISTEPKFVGQDEYFDDERKELSKFLASSRS